MTTESGSYGRENAGNQLPSSGAYLAGEGSAAYLAHMVVVLDTTRPRHPEKAHRPDAPAPAKPAWIRVKAPVSKGYADTAQIMRDNGLHTVCEEAGCPNIGECWEKKHATFLIMGDVC